jgi:hypothetical protein
LSCAAFDALDLAQRLLDAPHARRAGHPPGAQPADDRVVVDFGGDVAGARTAVVVELAPGKTVVQQVETFSGLLVPFAPALLASTRAGFEAMNVALARRAVEHAP